MNPRNPMNPKEVELQLKLPLVITHEWLKRHDACDKHLSLFDQEWPDGAEVSEANLRRAIEIGLDMEWLLRLLLPPSVYADYEAKRAPLYADYEAKRNALVIEILWPICEQSMREAIQ